MAGALRPAVLLIVLASLLFLATGWLDLTPAALAACRGDPLAAECLGPAGSTLESWGFGLANLVVALLIARGSERMLALRIGLAAFFVVERPLTAFAFGHRSDASLALHLVTAVVELVVLVSTLRVWRLGHGVGGADLAALSLSDAGERRTGGARG